MLSSPCPRLQEIRKIGYTESVGIGIIRANDALARPRSFPRTSPIALKAVDTTIDTLRFGRRCRHYKRLLSACALSNGIRRAWGELRQVTNMSGGSSTGNVVL